MSQHHSVRRVLMPHLLGEGTSARVWALKKRPHSLHEATRDQIRQKKKKPLGISTLLHLMRDPGRQHVRCHISLFFNYTLRNVVGMPSCARGGLILFRFQEYDCRSSTHGSFQNDDNGLFRVSTPLCRYFSAAYLQSGEVVYVRVQ